MKHASPILVGIATYKVGDCEVGLYHHNNRNDGCPYSLYWEHESNPIRHNMSAYEVFKALEKLLREEPAK